MQLLPSIRGRPFGLSILAVAMAVNGAFSLLESVGLADLVPLDPSVEGKFRVLSAIVGLECMHRAVGVWLLRRRAWLFSVIMLLLRVAIDLVYFAFATPSYARLISLVLAALTLTYIVQPGVRKLFAASRRNT